MLQGMIDELKSNLENKDAPYGVDLALPQVGGNARKTNVRTLQSTRSSDKLIGIIQYDYTHGQLPALTEVIIKNKASLFVCAVGVPPKDMVDKLHAAGILVMK